MLNRRPAYGLQMLKLSQRGASPIANGNRILSDGGQLQGPLEVSREDGAVLGVGTPARNGQASTRPSGSAWIDFDTAFTTLGEVLPSSTVLTFEQTFGLIEAPVPVLIEISIPSGIVVPLAPFDVSHVFVLQDSAFGIISTCGLICCDGDLECGRDSDNGEAKRCGCSTGQKHLPNPKDYQ
jgi:hypothetical protein